MKLLKTFFLLLDKFFFNEKFLEFWSTRKLNLQLERMNSFKINIYYNKDHTNLLSSLCDQHGSDKGSVGGLNKFYPWPAHTYTDLYSHLFSHCRFNVSSVFECGIGTNNPNLISSMGFHGKPGASLRVWEDYFPNARIFGADIDRNILFEKGRIRTYYMDQMNPKSIEAFWQCVDVDNFDIMIDDGLHTFDAGWTLFNNSIHKLSSDGIYIIEDVSPDSLIEFAKVFRGTEFKVDFVTLDRPLLSSRDNALILVRK